MISSVGHGPYAPLPNAASLITTFMCVKNNCENCFCFDSKSFFQLLITCTLMRNARNKTFHF